MPSILCPQTAYDWYQNEAVPQWEAANQSEDLAALKSLYQEALTIVNEVG